MRERFTNEEWALVRHIPVDAFIFVASADNKIDAKEHEEFLWTLEHGAEIPNPLHSEIASDIAAGGQVAITAEQQFIEAESVEDLEARINRSKAILKEKLTRDEYQAFLLSVLRSGVLVAGRRSRRKVFSIGSRRTSARKK